jgi:hypothetical protein
MPIAGGRLEIEEGFGETGANERSLTIRYDEERIWSNPQAGCCKQLELKPISRLSGWSQAI